MRARLFVRRFRISSFLSISNIAVPKVSGWIVSTNSLDMDDFFVEMLFRDDDATLPRELRASYSFGASAEPSLWPLPAASLDECTQLLDSEALDWALEGSDVAALENCVGSVVGAIATGTHSSEGVSSPAQSPASSQSGGEGTLVRLVVAHWRHPVRTVTATARRCASLLSRALCVACFGRKRRLLSEMAAFNN